MPERFSNELREPRMSIEEDSARRMRRSASDNGNLNQLGGSRGRSGSVEGGDQEHSPMRTQKKREAFLNMGARDPGRTDDGLRVLYDDEEKAALRFDDDGMLAARPLFEGAGLQEIEEEMPQTPSS